MTQVKYIQVSTHHRTSFGLVIRHAIFWSFLVATEAAAHMLFGGSWAIDVIVIAAVIGLLIALHQDRSGRSASMTKQEIAAWVAIGMPDDIQLWRQSRQPVR